MPADELRQSLKQKWTHARRERPNWERRRQEWVNAVVELHAQIQNEFVNDLIREGLLRAEAHEIELNEEYVGHYVIPELVLCAAGEEVILRPKGLLIANSKGRVDVIGEKGEATLVLLPEGWSIIASRTPVYRVIPLTKKVFREMLKAVMR